MRRIAWIGLLLVFATSARAQKVTGLSGWDVFLDPGHSQNENEGIFGYSEAKKTLRVGLELRRLLLETTDIDTVFISRTNDQQSVSLSQRVDYANATGAQYFQSIHSNAGGASSNFLFVLWPQYKDGAEAIPGGGRAMAQFVADRLSAGMRIGVSNGGTWGECDFYGVTNCRDRIVAGGKGGSRNYVQSYTRMASSLSEAGFHTNPDQNLLNMNADWKRLEARAMYWAMLASRGVAPPDDRIVTGIVEDSETGVKINGAVISIGDTTYTTDTWESLFHLYSTDPDELSNGFYYLDGLPSGDLPISVTADGFAPYESTVSPLSGTFTFRDIGLVPTALPTVVLVTPEDGTDPFRLNGLISVEFSRPMDRAATEAAFSIDPIVSGSFSWSDNNRRVTFRPVSLKTRTLYTITVSGTAVGAYGDVLDGDLDGAAGGDFVSSFTTGYADVKAPAITGSFPRQASVDVPLHPVLTLQWSEPLDSTTVFDRVHLDVQDTGAIVPGHVRYWRVGEKGLISFFPQDRLEPVTAYRLIVEPGVEDLFLNAQGANQPLRFTTGSVIEEASTIDDFETGVTTNWWQPAQSGSTVGTLPTLTGMAPDTTVAIPLFTGRTSMRIDFGWDPGETSPLLREYLDPGAPGAVTFDPAGALRVYVFGDGSGTRFRFAVDDDVETPSTSGTEVSAWIPIDWIGWQPVTWSLATDPVGSWIGDGALDGRLRFDSFQLSPASGGSGSGRVYFDDLQLVQVIGTAKEAGPEAIPTGFTLLQNYPNPFNPSTTIEFEVPATGHVRLVILDMLGRIARVPVDGVLAAGHHLRVVDATGLPSGVYFYRLETPHGSVSRRMTLLK